MGRYIDNVYVRRVRGLQATLARLEWGTNRHVNFGEGTYSTMPMPDIYVYPSLRHLKTQSSQGYDNAVVVDFYRTATRIAPYVSEAGSVAA